ncbi:proteasome regulatory particle subunit [Entomophthora muscae]|uniref:Proteasome regulatory particle subunit n=1 Tax=Entomophthora muscae TaxID=34485 RepID=A0ACC2SUW1_9FUNG|nr:proteasome regulatory particle subunit [Entomophthora muscae]
MNTILPEDQVPKIPNLDLRQHRFLLLNSSTDKESQKAILFEAIKADDMAPFYKLVCEENGFPIDSSLFEAMTSKNEAKIKEIELKMEEAKENEGESEVFDLLKSKAEYLAKIGSKDSSVQAYRELYEKAGTLGQKLDILFSYIRLLEEGGDWDRRNRLKVYEGIYLLSIRDFKSSANLLLDSVSTFTSTELMEYKDFVKYAVLTSMISISRVDMKKKVLDSPEILEVLHEIPHLVSYLNSLYQCHYQEFFESLAAIEEVHLFTSSYLFTHRKYYIREMRIIAYSQLLESYRSVTLESMAKSFGVSEDFIDRDVSKFIAAGRLHCVIDKVNGIIETNRADNKFAQYQAVIKQGDLLLNRVQKLSRVINI